MEPKILLDKLQELFPDSSKTTLRSWLETGRVLVAGKVEKKGNRPLREGELVELKDKVKKILNRLKVVYQDRHLIVIDKPAGLLSVPSNNENEDSACEILRKHFYPKKVYIVHRLDQATSGVMLFALTEEAMGALKNIFEKHEIDRKYGAVLDGRLPEEKGVWRSSLVEDKNYFVHVAREPGLGELAITHFEVKERGPKHTFVEFTLETGKKNQIRVQAKEAGFPVLGDEKYGRKKSAKRLCLHAKLLSFVHPFEKKKMVFESEVPYSFLLATRRSID